MRPNWLRSGRNPGAPSIYWSDLPLLRFFVDYPNYEHYWIIEYDVRFTGHWSTVLTDLKSSCSDLLCASLLARARMPDLLAALVGRGDGWRPVNPENFIKGFMPFCRVSNAAMRVRRRLSQRLDRSLRGDLANNS